MSAISYGDIISGLDANGDGVPDEYTILGTEEIVLSLTRTEGTNSQIHITAPASGAAYVVEKNADSCEVGNTEECGGSDVFVPADAGEYIQILSELPGDLDH
jgi:hypothetical protein